MAVTPVQRKLAAIFAADIAGYSRLMARDEVGTLARLKASRVIVDGLIASHRGRIFNTAGDSVVVVHSRPYGPAWSRIPKPFYLISTTRSPTSNDVMT